MFPEVPYRMNVVADQQPGKFNQRSQCSQYVIPGSRPPCPQCEDVPLMPLPGCWQLLPWPWPPEIM